MHPRLVTAAALLRRLALVVVTGAFLLLAAPGAAFALEVHHILPEPGSVVATPDHLEVMFDEAPAPGHVLMGISPDATNQPITLPALTIDENLVVQPLPRLPAGPYTAGFRVLGADGHVYQGSFGFTVGADGAVPVPAPAPGGRSTWLVPTVAAGLVVPGVVLAVLRFRRRRQGAQ